MALQILYSFVLLVFRQRATTQKRFKTDTRCYSIHLDLLAAKLIPDPFIGQNEANLQWIHDKTWVYTTTFETTAASQDEHLDLVFDGLDTFGTVKLNGEKILKCVRTTLRISR